MIFIEKSLQKRQNFNSRDLSMKMEVRLASRGVHKKFFSSFWVCIFGKFNQSWLKQLISFNFWLKILSFEKLIQIFSQKN